MNAVVSGRAGVALVMDGERVFSLQSGAGLRITPCRMEDFPFLFGDARDLRWIEDVEVPEIAERLAGESAKELALLLALILLDENPDVSHETRRAAGEELEAHFRRTDVQRFVESTLYSQPLPPEAGLERALAIIPGNASQARGFLLSLRGRQRLIATVHTAWEALPGRLFGGEPERTRIQVAAIRAGWFRDLVVWWEEGMKAGALHLEKLQVHQEQELLREWTTAIERDGNERPDRAWPRARRPAGAAAPPRFVAEGPDVGATKKGEGTRLIEEELRDERGGPASKRNALNPNPPQPQESVPQMQDGYRMVIPKAPKVPKAPKPPKGEGT